MGIGTFKTVYKGYDYDNGREIAWCEMNIEEKENKQYIHSIIKDYENIKELNHINLLEYIAIWSEEKKNRVVVITELLQGGNLREHRKYQKKLKIKLIKKWIKQILSALDYLHSHDYIHHDIKCQNILVDRVSGNLKLGDLLSSEKLGGREFFTKYIGTEEFMAPEVKEGKYTFKADIYSFGLTLLQLLTMEKPYKEFQRKINIYEAKKKGIFPLSFNQIKNQEIKNFISLCLREEEKRPTCKELLQNKWLNDNGSPDNNSLFELTDNQQKDIIYENLKSYTFKNSGILNNNGQSTLGSSSSLFNPNISKKYTMRPIYSLDISKLNSQRACPNRCSSFRGKKFSVPNSIDGVKSCFTFMIEHKSCEIKNKKKGKSRFSLIRHSDSFGLTKAKEQKKKGNFITIYLYIIEIDYKLFMILREKQDQKKNTLFNAKIIVSDKKWKKEKISENGIRIEYEYNGEKKSLEIIIENLKKMIDLNKNDILLIKKKLNGKITKIIKEKKIRDIKEKINNVIRNFESLLNNDKVNNLDNLRFDESKLPKESSDKINNYKKKKNIIQNLFSMYNLNDIEDYNNNYNLICQEYIILEFFEVDNT